MSEISVSLTEAEEAYARELVAQGRYASLDAVIQRAVDLLREQEMRELLARRREGDFISLDEGERRTQAMIARRKADRRM